MSALDGWIDICRAGTWRDTAGRDVALDEGRLDRIVDAHASADPAPVVVGHPEIDAPAYAWIDGLRRTGDRLQATLRDIAPAFREAVEGGRYSGRSIALQGDALRHLGFLGGRAPAVPGLAPTQFAAEADTVLHFAEAERPDGSTALAAWSERAVLHAIARTLRGVRERIIAADGVDAADAAITEFDLETITEAANAPPETDAARPAMAAPETMPATETDPANDGQEDTVSDEEKAALAAKETALDTRETALAAREAAQAAADRLAAADAALMPHIEAGRILPAERAGLAALLASLPNGDDETLTFAAADGGDAVSEAPRAVLERVLGALPKRVEFRTLAGGPAPEAAREDSDAIARDARALMASEAQRGVTLTPVEAVDKVRAERGLPTGRSAR